MAQDTILIKDGDRTSINMASVSDEAGFKSLVGVAKTFNLAVQMGQVDGHSSVAKFGVNREVLTSSDPEDLWEFGGIYPYDANGNAPIAYISSSDNADTQDILIQGLDINGNEVSQTITLTGQTNALLTTPLWRVYRMVNKGTVDIAGTVFCHTDSAPSAGVPIDSAVRAIIYDGNNQTLMLNYTIPKGKVGFLFAGELGISKEGSAGALAEYATCDFRTRLYGGVFQTKKSMSLVVGGGAVHQDLRPFPDVLPALTDLKVTVQEVSATMGLWATMNILLVDESKFSAEFLTEIGQP